MLAKELHNHLDKMEEIEVELLADIDKIIGLIDVDDVIADPKKAMEEVVEEIKEILLEKYAPMATRNGFDLARLLKKMIEQDREMKIDASKDGNKNKELVDGRNN